MPIVKPDIAIGLDIRYYNKYLKYKNKYMKLKNKLI
jgi:hypothetical protein